MDFAVRKNSQSFINTSLNFGPDFSLLFPSASFRRAHALARVDNDVLV
jgi:hypothetical protein